MTKMKHIKQNETNETKRQTNTTHDKNNNTKI